MNFKAMILGPLRHLGVHVHNWLDACIMVYHVVSPVPEPRRSV